MKLYLKISAYIVITLVWFGALVPHLTSAASDLSVALGVFAIIVYPIFTWKLFQSEIQTLKEMLNEDE